MRERRFYGCGMACQQENSTVTKIDEKRTKYRQLQFELRELRAEYRTYVISAVIGVLDGGIKKAINKVNEIFKQDNLSESAKG